MTDIHDLIGPEPGSVPRPEFPTPWKADGAEVTDATGLYILDIGIPGYTNEDEYRIAAFIAQAVNEKVARNAIPSRVMPLREQDPEVMAGAARVHDWHIENEASRYRSDVEYFQDDDNQKNNAAFYRIRSEKSEENLGRRVDVLYCDGDRTLRNDYLDERWIRECKIACTVLEVPSDFRL